MKRTLLKFTKWSSLQKMRVKFSQNSFMSSSPVFPFNEAELD